MTFLRVAFVSCNIVAVWGAYLLLRQRRFHERQGIPEPLKDTLTEKDLEQTKAYAKDSSTLELIEHARDAVVANAGLYFQLPAKVYYGVTTLLPQLRVGSFAHCYLYAVLGDVLSTVIELPFAYYHHFVIEARHGFNKMTHREFIKDRVKYFALRAAVMNPIMTGLIQWVVRTFGERFPRYFFLASAALTTAFTFLYPTLIAPLFNTYTPLEEQGKYGAFYKPIHDLADAVGFPLAKIYVIDGSRRSDHSNLYLYGFWKNKYIVIYDTFLDHVDGDCTQVVAAVAHELGHWRYWHTPMFFAVSMAQLMALSYGAKAVIFNPAIYKEFGFHEANPVIGFELFVTVFVQPIATLLSYLIAYITRRLEFQADRYAVKRGLAKALRRTLLTLARRNKAELAPDPLYSAFMNSHPPLVERLAAIEAAAAKLQ